MANYIPYLRLPRYNYNEASTDLRIIVDVKVDLETNKDMQVQDPIQINLVTYYNDLFVFSAAGYNSRTWEQEIPVVIHHGEIYNPATVTVLSEKIALIREKIKEKLGNYRSDYFTVIANVTLEAPTSGNQAKGVIGSGDSISIN
jgi:hypothetical protein